MNRHELSCGRRRLDALEARAEGHARPFELPGARAVYAGDQPFVVEHYRIEVSLDFAAKAIEGTTTLVLVARRRGVLRRVSGIDAARAVPGVEDVRITAKIDHLLVPLPEGASYLGFIFARGLNPDVVEQSLREAHARLAFDIHPDMRVLQSTNG